MFTCSEVRFIGSLKLTTMFELFATFAAPEVGIVLVMVGLIFSVTKIHGFTTRGGEGGTVYVFVWSSKRGVTCVSRRPRSARNRRYRLLSRHLVPSPIVPPTDV